MAKRAMKKKAGKAKSGKTAKAAKAKAGKTAKAAKAKVAKTAKAAKAKAAKVPLLAQLTKIFLGGGQYRVTWLSGFASTVDGAEMQKTLPETAAKIKSVASYPGGKGLFNLAAVLLFLLFSALPVQAQIRNVLYVNASTAGATVGAKVTTAVARCNASALLNCVLVIEPGLGVWTEGTMPVLAAHITLIDLRPAGAVALNRVDPGIINDVYCADGKFFTTIQAAIDAQVADAVDGGVICLPPTFNMPSSIVQITAPLDFSGKGDNWTFLGCGIFCSNIQLPNGADVSMFNAGSHSRPNIYGITFQGFKANQTAQNDCVNLGTSGADVYDTSTFIFSAVDACKGNGIKMGGSTNQGNVGHHNYWWNRFTLAELNGMLVVPPAINFITAGNLWEDHGKAGVFFDGRGSANNSRGVQRWLSLGDHFEANDEFGWRGEMTKGLTFVSPWIVNNESYWGTNVSGSALLYAAAVTGQTVRDAGFYNTILGTSCENHLIFPAAMGICSTQKKFPTKELHYDPSAVVDGDMAKAGVGAWTPDGNATIVKTAWVSATVGKRYLKITCSSAPCEATQDIVDTFASNGYFTYLFTSTSTDATGIAGVEIRRSTDDAVLASSGFFATPAEVRSSVVQSRLDFKHDMPATLTAGNWRIALRCNSTTEACFFTDLRFVRNFVLNGGMEVGSVGAVPTSWTEGVTNCDLSSTRARSGSQSVKGDTGGDAKCKLTQNLNVTLTPGEYYMASAWIFTEEAADAPGMSYGSIGNGTKVDGFFSNSRGFQTTRLEDEWEFVQVYFRVDDTGSANNQINIGTTFGAALTGNVFFDDVSVIHMRENVQFDKNFIELAAAPLVNTLEGESSNLVRWITKQVDHTDMAAAAAAATFTLFTLPANTMIHDVIGTVTAAWAGSGPVTAAICSVGTAGGSANDLTLDDTFFAVQVVYELKDATASGGKGALLFDATDKFAATFVAAAGDIELQCDLTGGDHADTTAGSARVAILVSQPLANTTVEAN